MSMLRLITSSMAAAFGLPVTEVSKVGVMARPSESSAVTARVKTAEAKTTATRREAWSILIPLSAHCRCRNRFHFRRSAAGQRLAWHSPCQGRISRVYDDRSRRTYDSPPPGARTDRLKGEEGEGAGRLAPLRAPRRRQLPGRADGSCLDPED